MLTIEKLVILSAEYPTRTHFGYAYVDQLACGLADLGVEVTVIAPHSVTKALLRGVETPPAEYERVTKRGAKITVLRPRYVSVSDKVLGVDTAMLSYRSFRRAALSEVRRRRLRPDAFYGHFIAMSGLCASELGEMMGIPAFLAYGESSPSRYAMIDRDFLLERLKYMSGIVSVSSENRRELIDMGLVKDAGKIGVFPNAIDREMFYPIDRAEAREKLGYDRERFIVSFVGSFSARKGVKVLSRALDALGDVGSVFIGRGDVEPDCANILFRGPVAQGEIKWYLSASDAFVLPTLNEGCCNAIIEAMGCALPIISSDRAFNDDILDETNSIRIDPEDESAVAGAIAALRGDAALRARLSDGALKKAGTLDIDARAKAIYEFMCERADTKGTG